MGWGGGFSAALGQSIARQSGASDLDTEIRSLRGGRYHLITHTASRQTHILKTTWDFWTFINEEFHINAKRSKGSETLILGGLKGFTW